MNLYQKKVVKRRFTKGLFMIVGLSLVLQQSFHAMPRQTAQATGSVCPAGDVKYNVGSGYEYTDNSATLVFGSVNGKNTVSWTAAPGFVIDEVCVKIGGPGGGSLKYPDVDHGEAGPYAYDISHVVVKTHKEKDVPPTIEPNPLLGQSCGLDIALVVDTSGSVSTGEMAQMKTALTNFATAFTGTPTVFSLSTFNVNSSQKKAFSRTPAQIAADIATDIPSAGNDNTNWDSGLRRGFATFDPRPSKSNLLVIATDGSPNRFGYPTATATFDWDLGVANAIPTANSIKTAGTRIVVVGIGDDDSDPASPAAKLDKMKAISGTTVATTPATITTATDVIKVTDFSGIGSALSAYANELCGGKILVQKQFDTNGDGQVDFDGSVANAALANWDFTVTGGETPATQTTTSSGALEFSVVNGTYAVQEVSTAPGTSLTSATCLNGQTEVGTFNPATRTVSGLPMATDETISCRFVNATTLGTLKVVKNVVGSDRPASDWNLHVKQADHDVTNSPQAGSSTGTVYTLPAGVYTVSETGPSGYTASFSENCPSGDITVVAGQEAVCTVTNTKNPDPIYAIDFEKSGPATTQPDGLVTYILAWEVSGDHAVTNAIVSDTIPAGTSFETATCGTTGPAFCAIDESNGVVTWNLGTRQPGDEGTVELTVKVASPLANDTKIVNTACFDTTETDKVCDDVTTTVISAPTITIDKQAAATVGAGQTLTYTLNWSVGGNAPTTNAIITDPLPANTTFVSADNGAIFGNNTVTWNLGAKNPGDTGTVIVTVRVISPLVNGTVLTNTACFDTTENTEVCDTTTTTVQSAPQLSIVKSNSVATFTTPGQSVLYTVTVTNAAGATDSAHDVILTDTLPNGFTFTVTGGSTKSFNLGTIVPGGSMTTTYTVTISENQLAGIYTNTATAKGSNTATVTATSNVDVRVPQVLGTSTPELTITKSVTPSVTNPGNVVSYTLNITNISDVTATNLIIVDKLPKGFTFVDGGKQTMTWKIAQLAAGKSMSIPYKVKVGESVRAGKYTNVASVTADDLDKQEAKAVVEIKVPQVLGLATTGAGARDYATMALGLSLITLGVIWYNRLRRRYAHVNS